AGGFGRTRDAIRDARAAAPHSRVSLTKPSTGRFRARPSDQGAALAAACGRPPPRIFFPLTTSTFAELGLAGSPLAALAKLGFETPTPIQAKAIPLVLDGGDLIGIAQTGTGKTGAFGLPLIQALSKTRPAGNR